MSENQSIRRQAQELFVHNLKLLEQGEIAEWVALFTPDGIMEYPYGPDGFPDSLQGHEEIHQHMRHFPEVLALTFSDPVFHETADPTLVIAEFTGTGTAVPTGNPVHQTFISVFRTENGRIKSFRDFWNPLVVIGALGSTDALNEAVKP
jgi:ketosteroid isomerase-like protein